MSLDAQLAPFVGASTWASDVHLVRDVAEHSDDWQRVVNEAAAESSADAWEVAEWIRVTRSRRSLAEFLRLRWLDAVAFLERLYRLRNRVVHEGAGLDSRDEPVFDEMAARGFAVFQPLLQRLSASVTSDTEAEERWEQAVLYMREATHTVVHGAHAAKEREIAAARPPDVDELSRWFEWPAPPGPPAADVRPESHATREPAGAPA
jgi:hypothetical protein